MVQYKFEERFMEDGRISVAELQNYWHAVGELKGDESIACVLPFQMPPWEFVCLKLDWDIYRVSGGYYSRRDHGFWGVYRLFALASDDDISTPATFSRLCCQDPTGTLYIGKASSLNDRLNQLRRSLCGERERSHRAAGALRALPGLHIPVSRLAIASLFTGRAIGTIERDLIEAYRNTYGDAPPLNYRV